MFFFRSSKRRLRALELDMEYVMAAIDDLKAQGADTVTALGEAVVLINDIAAKLAAAVAAHDEAALVQLAADLKAATDPLKAIVAAHAAPVA